MKVFSIFEAARAEFKATNEPTEMIDSLFAVCIEERATTVTDPEMKKWPTQGEMLTAAARTIAKLESWRDQCNAAYAICDARVHKAIKAMLADDGQHIAMMVDEDEQLVVARNMVNERFAKTRLKLLDRESFPSVIDGMLRQSYTECPEKPFLHLELVDIATRAFDQLVTGHALPKDGLLIEWDAHNGDTRPNTFEQIVKRMRAGEDLKLLTSAEWRFQQDVEKAMIAASARKLNQEEKAAVAASVVLRTEALTTEKTRECALRFLETWDIDPTSWQFVAGYSTELVEQILAHAIERNCSILEFITETD